MLHASKEHRNRKGCWWVPRSSFDSRCDVASTYTVTWDLGDSLIIKTLWNVLLETFGCLLKWRKGFTKPFLPCFSFSIFLLCNDLKISFFHIHSSCLNYKSYLESAPPFSPLTLKALENLKCIFVSVELNEKWHAWGCMKMKALIFFNYIGGLPLC